MRNARFLLPLAIILLPLAGVAQIPVFPDLEGDDLYNALVDAFTPAFTVGNSNSKDILFGELYNEPGDSVRCVYTGYTVYVDPNEDPSQAAFAMGLNTEHTYPKAAGSDGGPAESDLHHLHPTREGVNADRGNLPMGEVPDAQADEWYYLDQEINNIPQNNIERYSERQQNVAFEPREDHKGNVARAYFYFYTIYRQEAEEADPDFFADQQATLCDWHEADPVDAAEWDRTYIIASYQDDKPNPFVLDCTLAARLYCPGQQVPCPTFAATEDRPVPYREFHLYPNPSAGELQIDLELLQTADVEITLLDFRGVAVRYTTLESLSAGRLQARLSGADLPAGMYGVRIRVFANGYLYQTIRPWVRL